MQMDSSLFAVCHLPAVLQCPIRLGTGIVLISLNVGTTPSDRRNMHDYPDSAHELDLNGVDLSPTILAAVQRFARSRPWRGSLAERTIKFRVAIRNICRAAGIRPPRICFHVDEGRDSGASCYLPGAHVIILRGRLSVITALHEIGHALHGSSERMACAWSLAYFRECFPRSWRRLRFEGHMAVAR